MTLELPFSSLHRAFGDDRAKDADNLSFLSQLSAAEVDDWLRRVKLLREADRLAENQRMDPGAQRFTLYVQRNRHAWVDEAPESRAAWSHYLDALATYTCVPFELQTLRDHDRMLEAISGSLFLAFPGLDARSRAVISAFGALDQYWNNLRDLDEDRAQGICYFPARTLAPYGLTPRSVLDGTAMSQPEWRAFLSFWLDGYRPRLEAAARPFCELELRRSTAALRESCLARYDRVEQAVRRSFGLTSGKLLQAA
jgi:15-cis-phytoene synthase